MAIPIQNIYYLLCYAWDILDEQEPQPVSIEISESSLDLLLNLLHQQGEKLVRKGFAQQYIRKTETLRGIKGKLEVGPSVRQNSFRQGQAVCTFEELSPDILPNQIIKSVLLQVLKTTDLQPVQREKLAALSQFFRNISDLILTPAHFQATAAPSSFNKYYAEVLTICEFIWQQLLPEPSGENYLFIDFRQDERQMARLFEAFVRNFYRREQTVFTVKSERIAWQVSGTHPDALYYLPQMLTDISLEAPARKIIIDTKYYQEALVQHYDKQKLISGHLYQLFAYLKNQQGEYKVNTEGILLYPVVNQELDLTYQLPGHQISIKTINLNQPWKIIKADLLRLIA